jgi:hypothetical protein
MSTVTDFRQIELITIGAKDFDENNASSREGAENCGMHVCTRDKAIDPPITAANSITDANAHKRCAFDTMTI